MIAQAENMLNISIRPKFQDYVCNVYLGQPTCLIRVTCLGTVFLDSTNTDYVFFSILINTLEEYSLKSMTKS